MSISDPEVLINLYDWLETIPFSRPKKNFSRDFSDAVLAAELIKHFFPNLVEMHNYPCTNSVEQKKINWSTLNHRVLRKLDFALSSLTIDQLASGAKRDATEYFLSTLRGKIDERLKRKIEKLKRKNVPRSTLFVKKNPELSLSTDVSPLKSIDEEIKESLEDIGTHSAGKISWDSKNMDHDSVSRELYEQKVQELMARDEAIRVLKARIQRLEETLHLKNETIERLQQLLEKAKGSQKSYAEKLPDKKSLRIKTK